MILSIRLQVLQIGFLPSPPTSSAHSILRCSPGYTYRSRNRLMTRRAFKLIEPDRNDTVETGRLARFSGCGQRRRSPPRAKGIVPELRKVKYENGPYLNG